MAVTQKLTLTLTNVIHKGTHNMTKYSWMTVRQGVEKGTCEKIKHTMLYKCPGQSHLDLLCSFECGI